MNRVKQSSVAAVALIALVLPMLCSAASSGPRYVTNTIGSPGDFGGDDATKLRADDGQYSNYSWPNGFDGAGSDLQGGNQLGFSIPGTATITGIVYEVECKGSNMSLDGARLSKSATTNFNTTSYFKTSGVSLTGSDTIYTFGNSSDLWGTTWSVAQINSNDFGIGFMLGANAFGTASCDFHRVTVHYTVPQPDPTGTPDLQSASDTGSSSTDNNTSDTTPTFTVSCAGTNTVQLYVDGVSSGSSAACSSSTVALTTGTLSDGVKSITAKQNDGTSDSNDSSALSVTIDTTAPATSGIPDLQAASDSGTSSTDNITTDTTPTFDIACTTGDTVELLSGATVLGSGTCASSTVAITSSTLTSATYLVKAQETDAAGNTSSASSTLSVTIDTSAPAASGVPDLEAGSDTGTSSTDNLTNDTTPSFTISCETGAAVSLLSGATVLGTGTCSGSTVSITSSSLTAAIYLVKSQQTDPAGNISTASSTLSITINTTVPTTVSLSPLDDAIDVSITSDLVLTLSKAVTGNGAKNITIKKTADDTTVETLLGNAAEVAIATDVVTINPTATLENNTGYYILIDSGTFSDSSGNEFAGIASTTTWNFTTVAAASSSSSSASSDSGGGGGSSSSQAPTVHSGGGRGGSRGTPPALVPGTRTIAVDEDASSSENSSDETVAQNPPMTVKCPVLLSEERCGELKSAAEDLSNLLARVQARKEKRLERNRLRNRSR